MNIKSEIHFKFMYENFAGYVCKKKKEKILGPIWREFD